MVAKTKVVHTSPAGITTISTDIGVSYEDAYDQLAKWKADGHAGGWASRYDSRSGRLFTLMARIDGFVQKALWRDRLETQRELSELVLDGHALYDAQLQRLRTAERS